MRTARAPVLCALRSACSSHLQELALADRECHIHRIAADDHGQWAAVRTDHISLGEFGAADLAADRRDDLGVAEVDVGGLQVGIRDDHLALRALLVRHALVQQGPGGRVGLHQFLRAPALRGGIGELALRFNSAPWACCTAAWKRVRLDPVEDVALLDDCAFLEQHVLQETGHPGPDLHPLDGLHPPDEFGRLGDRPQLGRQRADRNRSRLLRPSIRHSDNEADQRGNTNEMAHSVPRTPYYVSASVTKSIDHARRCWTRSARRGTHFGRRMR